MSDEASATRIVYLLAWLALAIGSGHPGHAAAQSRVFTYIERPDHDSPGVIGDGALRLIAIRR